MLFQGIGVARGKPCPPQNWGAINDKNVTKNTIVSLVSVFFSIFAYNSTRVQLAVINNCIDPGGPGHLSLIFTSQFKWAFYNNI